MKKPLTACQRCNRIKKTAEDSTKWRTLNSAVYQTGRRDQYNRNRVWLCPPCFPLWERDIIQRHNDSLADTAKRGTW